MWHPQIERLQQRFHVLAPDLPGLAGSAKAGPFTMERASEAVDALIRQRGGAEVHLCGLSLGAMVALHLAGQRPNYLLSLTISGAQVQAPRLLANIQKLVLSVVPEAKLVQQVEKLVPASDAAMRAVAREDMQVTGKRTFVEVTQAAITADLRPQVARIAVPTCIINGAKDRPNLGAAQQLARTIPGAQLQLIEGAGHLVSYERPEAFTDALTAFIGQVAGQPVPA